MRQRVMRVLAGHRRAIGRNRILLVFVAFLFIAVVVVHTGALLRLGSSRLLAEDRIAAVARGIFVGKMEVGKETLPSRARGASGLVLVVTMGEGIDGSLAAHHL
jgi:hypothetical protein